MDDVDEVPADLASDLTAEAGSSFPEQSDSRIPQLLCEERHDAGDDGSDRRLADAGTVSRWRQKEKLKTTAVALVLCLNIGVDPPDTIKISPCARLECWVDPLSMQAAKALETIGKNLQAQYERWQPRAKYKMHLDPTVEDIKKLCVSCRRNAKNERVLLHYNGHGVPRPTINGELWVFNSRYTQYIPLSIYELQSWLGTPCIYVLDCSAAGVIIQSFRSFLDQRQQELMMPGGASPLGGAHPMGAPFAGGPMGAPPIAGGPTGAPFAGFPMGGAVDPMKEIIVLAACGANELLPQNPDLPADVFTACLTTPIKVALRWFCERSLMRHDGVSKDLIDRIPGRQTDRKTPLGELNWVFTAITDTIAWNMLPRPLFQKLFRSDLLVASLFRNFLLAERIMTAANCTPISYPRLPPTHQHPMWQAWDMAAEMCLMQLPRLLADANADFVPSSFFSEQLTAFELWLAHGSKDKKPPEQLPIVLQVLLSQVHRLRALVLLGRFLDMGPWAVDLALSVGIFPYVLKLLQTTSSDLRSTLVFIWCKILALDRTCQVDLVKDAGHLYFIKYLDTIDGQVDLYSRAQAAFVLSVICDGHFKGQALCLGSDLLPTLLKWLRSLYPPQVGAPFTSAGHALLLRWLCMSLGKLCEDVPEISLLAIREGAADMLVHLLSAPHADIRAAALFGLGCLIHSVPTEHQVQHYQSHLNGAASINDLTGIDLPPCAPEERLPAEQLIANAVRQLVYDSSVLVRSELAVLYTRFARGHAPYVHEALVAQQRRLQEFARANATARPSLETGVVASMSHLGDCGDSNSSADSGGPLMQFMNANSGLGTRSGHAGDEASGPAGGTATEGEHGSAGTSGSSGKPSLLSPSGSALSGAPHNNDGAGNAPLPGARPPSTYAGVIDSVQMLALDPAPKVAHLGRIILRSLQCELAFTPSHHSVAGGSGNNSLNSVNSHSSVPLGVFTNKLRKRPWLVNSAPHSAQSVSRSMGAPTPPSSSPPSPPPAEANFVYSRHPFVLRTVGSGADSVSEWDAPVASSLSGDLGHGSQRGPGGYPMEQLPLSPAYKAACEYFSRPMLEPMASAWRESEGAQLKPWIGPVDAHRRTFRLREVEAGMARCKALTAPKLREQVYTIETGSDLITTLAFHPYHPLLITTDNRGYIRVSNYNDSTCINAFHVATGAAISESHRMLPSQVVCLRHLNEADGPLLLAGSADGAVRVWRSYTLPNSTRLATAFQSVQMNLPPAMGHAANFEWSAPKSWLYASGGSHPDCVCCWDLHHELCANMIPLTCSNTAAPLCVERLVLGTSDPNCLLVGCSEGSVRLFDLRASRQAALVLHPFGRQQLAGCVYEPNGRPGLLVTASEKGELQLQDLRMALGAIGGRPPASGAEPGAAEAGSSTSSAAIRTVQAHSKGGVSSLVGHAHAPLLATSTTTQVVKVWTDSGDVVGAIRAQSSSFLAHKMGPVSCMAFHPYQLLLAAGGVDSVCTVYVIDNNPSAARPSGTGA